MCSINILFTGIFKRIQLYHGQWKKKSFITVINSNMERGWEIRHKYLFARTHNCLQKWQKFVSFEFNQIRTEINHSVLRLVCKNIVVLPVKNIIWEDWHKQVSSNNLIFSNISHHNNKKEKSWPQFFTILMYLSRSSASQIC